MLIGYMRVSKADGSQSLDLQRDALIAAGVQPRRLYENQVTGKAERRPGLDQCLKALRTGDTLVVWKLDRLGRDLRHLVNLVHELTARDVGFRVFTGEGAAIDTTTPSGKLVLGIFAALAEFERELIRERTIAGLAADLAVPPGSGAPGARTPAVSRRRDRSTSPIGAGSTPAEIFARTAATRTAQQAGRHVSNGGACSERPRDVNA